ncbi:MAG: ABC transporter permease [Bacteroidota bacterium]
MLAQIGILLRQELRSEWRNPYTLVGILLYVLAAVLIAYVALTRFSIMVWNPIFWILLFFAAISATGRSFRLEQGRRQLYYYTLISPEALLLSKLIYNTFVLVILGLLLWGLLIFFNGSDPVVGPGEQVISTSIGNPISDNTSFLLALFLGSLGLSAAFSFVAAIATRAGGNATLMSILAFPLVIPLLILLVRVGAYAIGLLSGSTSQLLSLLMAIDLLLIATGVVLFPYIWRD